MINKKRNLTYEGTQGMLGLEQKSNLLDTNTTSDSFKTSKEKKEDDHAYIQPNIETELSSEKRQECRDIVLEIKKFGVNQRQILHIINLLAMELEQHDAVKKIAALCGEGRKVIPVEGTKLAGVSEKKLLLEDKPINPTITPKFKW